MADELIWEGRQSGQHDFLCDMAPGWSLYQGGLGCVAGHTRVALADGTHRPIAELFAEGLPIHVLTTRGPVWCPPPTIGPIAEMLQIKVAGRVVTVTSKHRFYTSHGWREAGKMNVGASILCLPSSNLDNDPLMYDVDDLRYSEIVEGYQSCCRQFSHSHDRQPQQTSDIDQLIAQPLNDARGHTRHCLMPDDPGYELKHIRPCLGFSHPSMPDCFYLHDSADLVLVQSVEENGGLPRPSRQQRHRSRQSVTARHACFESILHSSNKETIEPCGQRDDQAWDTPLINESIGAFLNVSEITKATPQHFYDINVPGVGHYLAEGIWHHNSGKTWAAARKFLVMHSLNDCQSMIVAPTYGDLWRYMVPELMRAAEEWGIEMRVWSNGHGVIKYPHIEFLDHPILLLSGDQPQRIAGFEVGLIWVDEGARIKEDKGNPTNDGPTQIRTRLRNKNAKVLHGMVSTTPEGLETWVQRDWTDALKPDHRKYKGTTKGNDMLPEGYLSALQATMGKDLQAQYLDGEAVNYSAGRAHATFDRLLHVKSVPFDPRKQIHVGADFNVAPMAWVICQLSDNRQALHVLDEMYIDNHAQVDSGVMAMIARGWDARKGAYELHPDKSSKRRSTVGDPEITVLLNTARAQHMNIQGDAFGVNPPIDSRINLVCRMLLDAGGVARMTVDPRCIHLIEDLEKTGRIAAGYDPGPEGKRGHILDGLGYVCWDLFQPGIKASVQNWHL